MERSSTGSETVQPVSLCMSLERTFRIGRNELLGEAKWNTVSFMWELISPGYKNGVGMKRGNKDAECIHESTRMPQGQLREKPRTFSIHTCGLNDGFLCSLRRSHVKEAIKQLVLPNPPSLATLVMFRATNVKAGLKSFSPWTYSYMKNRQRQKVCIGSGNSKFNKTKC